MAGCVIAEAAREHIILSQLEEAMLLFSETFETSLQDVYAASEAFDLEHSAFAYEQKIEALIRRFLSRARKQAPTELASWNEAVKLLQFEDYYLAVMVEAATRRTSILDRLTPQHIIMTLSMTCIIVALIMIFDR